MNKIFVKPLAHKLRLISFFASLCLFLSAVEYVIPKPLPFMRLGLANVPIIAAFYIFTWKEIFILVLLKVLGQGLITGTLFSYIFVFSAAGSFSGALAMFALQRLAKGLVSPVGISLAGAFANTAAQILMSRIMLFGEGVRYIVPVLLVSGFITGFSLGLFTRGFMQRSRWFATILQNTKNPAEVLL